MLTHRHWAPLFLLVAPAALAACSKSPPENPSYAGATSTGGHAGTGGQEGTGGHAGAGGHEGTGGHAGTGGGGAGGSSPVACAWSTKASNATCPSGPCPI